MIDLPVIVDPEDALAQPTRARLFALLSELKRPAGTAELAERLRLHPNGVRVHLVRMAQQGLVERTRARQPRGRPPAAWTISPQALPGGRAPRAYHDLGRWLARALRNRRGGLRGIEATGREIGRELAPKGAERDSDALETTLSALGFQPTVESRAGDRMAICLGNCPYRDAVRENQPAICALHRGITRGLLDVLEPQAKLAGFVPHDPDRAGCQIELRGMTEQAGARRQGYLVASPPNDPKLRGLRGGLARDQDLARGSANSAMPAAGSKALDVETPMPVRKRRQVCVSQRGPGPSVPPIRLKQWRRRRGRFGRQGAVRPDRGAGCSAAGAVAAASSGPGGSRSGASHAARHRT